MAIYVYVSSKCRDDARRQNHEREIERLKDRIERDQHLDIFDRFPPPYLKKRFERQIRVVSKEYRAGEDTVVVLLRLVVRSGSEYQTFIDSQYTVLPGLEQIADELTEQALLAYVAQRQDPLPPPAPAPSESEASYLYSVLSANGGIYHDWHCCETDLWVERIQSDQLRNHLSNFREDILDTITLTGSSVELVHLKSWPDCGFLCRALPERKLVVLLAPFRGDPPVHEVEKRYRELVQDEPITHETVLRHTKRAYPHELLLNEDAWLQVEGDKDGNMALSPEEVAVLDSVRANSEGSGFPLFINGRAGSGKSTILQYLFSEYLQHHLEDSDRTSPPIYYACNDELLRRAEDSVRNLLKARAVHGDHGSKIIDLVATNGSFRNFYGWLREQVPQEKFQIKHLIDYGGFKRWWESSFGQDPSSRRLFDADISWHVIRTYIKGISADGLLEPDDYREIPQKQKSVRPETFEVVFERVWKRYSEYQEECGLWDHQDLARFALENGLIRPECPVVFCDEAQDFTRIELEVLDRSCLFSARSLQGFQLSQVPLAFAGDPFQTLNPTGFRWEATKAFFTEKFLKRLQGQLTEINYQELTYNYRSNRNIVRFCNSLQLLRSSVFDISEIRPQRPWLDDREAPSVVYFYSNDLDALRALKHQSEIRIIVPCEEGMEGEWAKQNGLGEYVEFDEAGVPKNVVNATRVKGLEFPRVVLFGFGRECPPALRKALRESSRIENSDQAIEPQYYLNRLYVAASRPRKRLFIIDSEDDIKTFWNQIFDESPQESRISTLEQGLATEWLEGWGEIKQGGAEAWGADSEDPEETAIQLAREGASRKDRVLLRQAAQSFDSAGKSQEAKQCRAEALEIEENFLIAARVWEELGNIKRSVIAAWCAGTDGYDFVRSLGSRVDGARIFLEFKVVEFLESPSSFSAGVTLFEDILSGLAGEDHDLKKRILMQPTWADAFASCVSKLLESNAEVGLWKLINSLCGRLAKEGLEIQPGILGEVAYRSGLLKDAYNHWAKVTPTHRTKLDDAKFLRAKVASVDYPSSLDCANELLAKFQDPADAEQTLQLVRSEQDVALSSPQREAITRANLLLRNVEDAVKSLSHSHGIELLRETVEAAVSDESAELVAVAVLRVFEKLVHERMWDQLFEFAQNRRIRGSRFDSYIAWSRGKQAEHLAPLIRLLIDDQVEMPEDFKKRFGKLLKEGFTTDVDWRHLVHPLEVGAVIEIAGQYIDALGFYEHLQKPSSLSDQLREDAMGRWLYTKQLQIERERTRGNRAKAEDMDRDAKSKSLQSGVAVPTSDYREMLKHLPPVDAGPTAKAEPKTSSVRRASVPVKPESPRSVPKVRTVGNLEVRVSPDLSRINIDNTNTFEQAHFRISEMELVVEGETFKPGPNGLIEARAFGLRLDVGQIGSGKLTVLTDTGSELTIDGLLKAD